MNIHNATDDAENGRIKKGAIGEWDSLFVPNSIKVIEAGAYKGCTNIKEIVFEDGGESPLALYEEAFADCTGLQRVKLPARVETIQDRCFSGCIRLEDFEIEQGERPLCVGFFVFAECPNGGEMKTVVEEEQQARRGRKTSGSRTGLQRENSQVLPQAIELINDLDKLIREHKHNPWTKLSAEMEKMVGQSWDAGFTNDPDVRFALDDDVEKIKEYNNRIQRKIEEATDNKKREKYRKLLLRVDKQQPIPFIGHPEAKVWVLAMNPSFSNLEWCTFIECKNAEAEPGARTHRELTDVNCFKIRQELYAKSLNFSNKRNQSFYVLDKSMNVVESDGNQDLSGFLWYGKRYFPRGEGKAFFNCIEGCDENRMGIASKHFFALEFLPYPSEEFDSINNYGELLKSPHVKFWEKLVKYALYNDKILIVRGRIMDKVRNVDRAKFEEARRAGRILKFFNSQQISITRDNVVEYGARKLEEYCDKIGE